MVLFRVLISALVVSCTLGSSYKYASVTYDKFTRKFILHDYIAPHSVANASFKDEISVTGWSYLEVHTSEFYPDPDQVYAAGLLEGYLTRDLLKKHWNNTAADYCVGEEEYCKRLSDFLQQNLDFIEENIRMRQYDPFWHHVALTLEQLHGLEDGLKNLSTGPSTKVEVLGLLLMNLMGDLFDLEIVLDKKEKKTFARSSCSALIKVLPGNKDVYFSHDTWNYYNTMLRILKKYNIRVHSTLSSRSVVPGHTYTFSSQPGLIFSADDFYLISSGLAVMETTIDNDNANLWQYVKPVGTILDWQRNIIANRLANNGKQWTNTFGTMNSGTYNNQWMILDYNKFQPDAPLQDGFLFIFEQLPGYFHTEDMTHILRNQSYWPSYNIAYFKDIFIMSDAPENVKKYGDYFTYERSPRGLIFKRDHSKVTDIPSMIKLMRYNDYIHDPISQCNCTPPQNAHKTISSRDDLNPENGTYPFKELKHKQYGGIDMKLTTSTLFKTMQFVAISGPTYDSVPPFQWSTSDFDKKVKHEGHPDLWKFEPIVHKWLNATEI